jgi:hypothetical protein
MLAIELGICTAISAGWRDTHFVIRSDNMGVIGALRGGRSSNLEQNRVLQRIVALMRAHGIWITLQYVPSAENIADRPSRGLAVPNYPCSCIRTRIPACIAVYIVLADISD